MRLCVILSLAVLVSGCYTQKALHIGERHEWPRRIVNVFRDGDHVVISVVASKDSEVVWRADDSGRRWEPIVPEVSGWATADLGTLAWGPVTHPDVFPGGQRQLALHEGTAPPTPVPPYEEIPLVRLPPTARGEVEKMRSELREALDSHQLLAATMGEASVLLVHPDPQATEGLSMTYLRVDGRLYRAWWAIPVRIVAVPLMIPVDAVYMPAVVIHMMIYGWC